MLISKEEKVRLIKIGIFSTIILGIVAFYYFQSYVAEKKFAANQEEVDYKQGAALKENDSIQYLFKYLNLPEGYEIEVFSNSFDHPVALTDGPFAGMIVADYWREGLYQLVDNTNDNISDFNTRIEDGLGKISVVDFHHDKIYVALEDGVYSYAYSPMAAVLSDKHKILDSSLLEGTVKELAADDDYLYILLQPDCKEDCDRLLGSSLLKVTVRGYFTVLFENWPYCNLEGFSFFGQPCLDEDSPVYDYLSKSDLSGMLIIDSPMFPEEWQGDAFVALRGSVIDGEATGYKIIRLIVEEDKIVGFENFLTGFTKRDNINTAILGRPFAIQFNHHGDLFILDDYNDAVYKVFKKE